MGSWNDQSFSGDEEREYGEVSNRLFEIRRSYFETLLCFRRP
jgi:hypothetical protein